MRTVFISDDPMRIRTVREKLASLPAPPFRKTAQPPPEAWCLLGSATEVGAQIRQLRDALGMTHLIAVRPRVSGIDEDWLTESFAALSELQDRN
jgi:hypothetical protein